MVIKICLLVLIKVERNLLQTSAENTVVPVKLSWYLLSEKISTVLSVHTFAVRLSRSTHTRMCPFPLPPPMTGALRGMPLFGVSNMS